MSQKLDDLIERLWKRYISMTPQAHQVIQSLIDSGENRIINDHIAFRTFQDPLVGMDVFSQPFLELGYEKKDRYQFPEKKLDAYYLLHPDSKYPKIFVSELKLDEISKKLRDLIISVLSKMPSHKQSIESPLCLLGRPWTVSKSDYEFAVQESEYAGWMLAFGFCPNHFTVNVGSLKNLKTIPEVNTFLKSHGFLLNSSGGEVKGTPKDYLEQSSTLAEIVPVQFSDGSMDIPSCYYEFALRYPLPSGEIYQGFVPTSADKIFESTHRRS